MLKYCKEENIMKDKEQKEEKREVKNRNLVINFRIFQAIFIGLFALGISMMGGEISSYSHSPISSFSITTTIFGLIGTIASGMMAKRCENW